MPTDPHSAKLSAADPAQEKPLTPEAQRALAEAAARRTQGLAKTDAAEEIGGRGGLDPARYGDWEINGLAADF